MKRQPEDLHSRAACHSTSVDGKPLVFNKIDRREAFSIDYLRSTGGAYRWDCTVMVWDKANGALLAENNFRGSDPPSTSKDGETQTGSKPYKEIADYLNGLAH